MNANDNLDRRLADHYENEAPARAPDWVLRSALQTIDTTPQRRAVIAAPWRFPRRDWRAWLVLAAAALVAVTVLGAIGLGAMLQERRPDVITPDPATLVWTQEGLVQDWPAPVRPEPPSGATVKPMGLGDDARWDPSEGRWEPFEHPDPVGDIGSAGPAWIDIREVHAAGGSYGADFTLKLAGDIPRPVPDPASDWIAYGVVLDTNGDGIADVRIGMDNLPAAGGHRAWRTDLATGRTHAKAGPPYGSVRAPGDVSAVGPIGLDTYYPDESQPSTGAILRYSLQNGERAFRFYVWASVIEAGHVLATDYAPDVGWLVKGSQPEPTLAGPTWLVESDFDRGGESMTLVQSLEFTAAGGISFDAGCTTGSGTVVVEAATLRIRDLVLADASCGSGIAPLTARFLDILTAGDIAYALDPGLLELRAGTGTLRFHAEYDWPPA
ncbi:MAG TPA: hypothetical protein VHK05_07370 [Candidatus Limnocylindrales bacterium]|nr:hypothetical protein [Candidatus Limnocylindrales bacterium]